MKRSFILLIFLMSVVPCAFCMQDSIRFDIPEDLYGFYIPQNLDNTVRHTMSGIVAGGGIYVYGIGVGFHSTEDLRVKGISAYAGWWSSISGIVDTMIDYNLTASVLKYVDENNVNYIRQTAYNILYPAATDTMIVSYDSVNSDTIVLQKAFFAEPAVVSDTFFCIIEDLEVKDKDSASLDHMAFCIATLEFIKTNDSNALSLYGIPVPTALQHSMDIPSCEWYKIGPADDNYTQRILPFIFPILDLGDSAGVAEADAVGRNTAVWPNPARGTVSVASGFGLKRVTVHDIGGRLVLSREASGLSTSIDVSSLPRGAYLVTVETLVGITTKKLLVE